jgi:tetratricopeptide (TPR) repeat protein
MHAWKFTLRLDRIDPNAASRQSTNKVEPVGAKPDDNCCTKLLLAFHAKFERPSEPGHFFIELTERPCRPAWVSYESTIAKIAMSNRTLRLNSGLRLAAALSLMLGGATYAQVGPHDKSDPEREPSPECGTFDYRYVRNAAGPADYRQASDYLIRLVENAHFTQEVELLVKGKSSTIGGDIAYTLNALPNHPRALRAAAAYERKLGPVAVKEMGFSTKCWFDRAISFRSNDANARIVIAAEFIRRKQIAEATEHVRVAEKFADRGPLTVYNLGLLNFEIGDYDRALSYAKEAQGMGVDLPGLRQKLEKVGRWN